MDDAARVAWRPLSHGEGVWGVRFIGAVNQALEKEATA